MITDPDHKHTAGQLRATFYSQRTQTPRRHQDGHPVAIRALTDYDALFGVDFDPTSITNTEEAR